MGEAKRRQATRPTREEFIAMLESINGGRGDPQLFDLYLVYTEQLPELWTAGMSGDLKAAYRFDTVCRTIGQVGQSSSSDKPVLCLLCDHAFTDKAPPPACIAVLSRYDQPVGAICNALCNDCQQQPDLLPRIAACYRDAGVISDARMVSPPSAPGHA